MDTAFIMNRRPRAKTIGNRYLRGSRCRRAGDSWEGMFMLPGKLCVGILEEDNPQKSDFRFKPLLSIDEDRLEDGIAFAGVGEALAVPRSDLRLFGKPESFRKRRMFQLTPWSPVPMIPRVTFSLGATLPSNPSAEEGMTDGARAHPRAEVVQPRRNSRRVTGCF